MPDCKFLICLLLLAACSSPPPKPVATMSMDEPHRPQIHFSPKKKWMNDPNGMVYYKGVYHLFYQYFPDSTVWGPMHWGHATSHDLIHWEHQPIALYPDSLGYIFSGSTVVDSSNTSGFGRNGKVPLVAIFTQHDPKGEKAGRTDFQNQSLAYSLDEGRTWIKYSGNPTLKNPGIKDFRDPKVRWYPEAKKWIMTLATQDRVSFYSSPNLKDWTKESEFGQSLGAHGGVWECPDLFPMEDNGRTVWVLLVSINPGGPNGGSATQYFTGHFDGHQFTTTQTDTRWIDYGPDDYAGVTWSNTGKRHIFLGWMSNWQYATVVPTEKWRSAMTLPRELSLLSDGSQYRLLSQPVKELDSLEDPIETITDLLKDSTAHTGKWAELTGPTRLKLKGDQIRDFSIVFSNLAGEQLTVGYDSAAHNYYIDRRASGNTSFEKGFSAKHTAPRLSTLPGFDLELVIDNASVELFADKGQTVMTSIFFPYSPYSRLDFSWPDSTRQPSMEIRALHRIW